MYNSSFWELYFLSKTDEYGQGHTKQALLNKIAQVCYESSKVCRLVYKFRIMYIMIQKKVAIFLVLRSIYWMKTKQNFWSINIFKKCIPIRKRLFEIWQKIVACFSLSAWGETWQGYLAFSVVIFFKLTTAYLV